MTISDCKPSIQRFYGALLFVDISGFTILSQKLSVEDLKNHINDYFTKMLDIVDRHGGDVVKFAGDALFIAFPVNHPTNSNEIVLHQRQTSVNRLEDNEFSRACKAAVEKAVACGIEIAVKCSNHKISLIPTNTQNSATDNNPNTPAKQSGSMFRRLLPTMFNVGGGNNTSNLREPLSPSRAGVNFDEEEDFAYLNVHAGVSTGLMAGIDIGTSERFEYFLVGEPLTKVAVAEGQAKLGDIVICPETHAILHATYYPAGANLANTSSKYGLGDLRGSMDFSATPKKTRKVSSTSLRLKINTALMDVLIKDNSMHSVNLDGEPSCDCSRLERGYYCLNTKQFTSKSFKRSKVKSKLMEAVVGDEDSVSVENRLVDQIEGDIDSVYALYKQQFSDKVGLVKESYAEKALVRMAHKTMRASVSSPGGSLEAVENSAELQEMVVDEEQLKRSFQKWILACLSDDLARHVHHVARNDYIFKGKKCQCLFSSFVNTVYTLFSAQTPLASACSAATWSTSSPSSAECLSWRRVLRRCWAAAVPPIATA